MTAFHPAFVASKRKFEKIVFRKDFLEEGSLCQFNASSKK
jgi:hypothetical protein